MSTETTIEQRAERAYRLLLTYEQRHEGGSEDHETAVTDLLADLMHLCDQYAIEWGEVEERAAMHHFCEKTGREPGEL